MGSHRLRKHAVGALAAVLSIGLVAAGGPAVAAPTERPQARDVDEAVVELGVAELSEMLSDGEVTSVQLVKAYRERIAAYEDAYAGQPGVNAVITYNRGAIGDAARLDAERRRGQVRGPLHGIPVVVKDNYDTGDMPTSNGSVALEDWQTADDAEQVARLREAGAVIVAKTNLHEYAAGITTISSLGGQTRNPYDQSRNPGGSSGGTGAAVAAAFAAVGMGSDTCGSIRIPAAHNALVGLRPTLGLSSRDGIAPMSATQDVGGPLARSVTDLALVLDATVGYDPKDPVTSASLGMVPDTYLAGLDTDALAGRRIGLLTSYLGSSPAEQQTSDLIVEATEDMASLGATVVEIDEPLSTSGSSVLALEFARDLDAYLAAPGTRYPADLAALEAPADVVTLDDIVTSGQVTPSVLSSLQRFLDLRGADAEYAAALEARAQLQDTVQQLFATHDLDAVVYPTIRQQAAPVGEPQPGSNCSLSAHTGFPALTVPAGYTADGMPVGAELLGTPFSEPELLGMGFSYEQATQHREPPASTPVLDRPHGRVMP